MKKAMKTMKTTKRTPFSTRRSRTVSLLLVASMAALSRPGTAQEHAVFQNLTGGGIDEVGRAVGDINGDGFDDLAFMVRQDLPRGSLVIVLGRPGLAGTQTLSPGSPGTVTFRVGDDITYYAGDEWIQGAGDLDGDGFDDLLFSLPYAFGAGGDSVGKGFLLYGAADLAGEHLVGDVGETLEGVVFESSNPAHDGIGRVVAGIGDMDGDGQEDIAISASMARNPYGRLVGMVFVLTDTKNLPGRVDLAAVGVSIPGTVVHGDPESSGRIGYGVEGLGDFDGDGLDDLLVESGRGAYVIHGRPSFPALLDLAEMPENVNEIFVSEHPGLRVRGGGDLDNDGLADILLNTNRSYREEHWTRIYIVHGRDGLPPRLAADDPAGPPKGVTLLDHPGRCLWASATDVIGDESVDLLLSAPDSDVGGLIGAGEAYVLLGNGDAGLAWADIEGEIEGIRLFGDGSSKGFGSSLAPVGDFDGDGAPDLLVRDSGRAFLFYGSRLGEPGPVVIGGDACQNPRANRVPVPAEEIVELDVTYRLEDATAEPGGTVGITFNVRSDRSIEGLYFSIDFDESILELTSTETLWTRPDGSPLILDLVAANNDDDLPGDSGLEEGYVVGALVADAFCDDFNLPPDTIHSVAELHFRVKPEAQSGMTEIRIVHGAPAPSGIPVKNAVTVAGVTVIPELATSFVYLNSRITVLPDITVFVRGDSNGDYSVDLSDPIRTLSFLFLGGKAPRCMDAADFNDDGRLDVTDPIATLDFLFLSGRTPPEPFGAPGLDPTPDALYCLAE